MFERCDFLLGDGYAVVIVIPAHLPKAETYTVSISNHDIRFKADHESIAEVSYKGGEVYERISRHTQIGIVEYPPNNEQLPDHITTLAYVEVRRAS